MSNDFIQQLRCLKYSLRILRVRAMLLLLLAAGAWGGDETGAASAPDAFAQNQRLGRGVNILGYDPIWRSQEQARFQARHFRLLHEAGFESVRINLHPFRHASREPDWKLPGQWFATADWALTNAVQNGLSVILDLHEFNDMGENPEGCHDQFLATWKQLADHYKSAPDGVLFEILNEPAKALTPELWNRYLKEALARTAESFGWSWAYWQFDSDFILFDIAGDSWVRPIRDALAPPGDSEVREGRYQGKPFQGWVQPVPGRLECEFYDEGGEGVAYHETDGRNHGSGELNKGGTERDNFRKEENVDISYTKNDWDNSEFNRVPQELGRFYLGWTAAGEWVRYTVDIAKPGLYSLGVMYTARYDGGILLKCDERTAGPAIRLASTADSRDERRNWHHWNFHEQKDAVFLPAGRHVLTVLILNPGNLNLDRIDLNLAQKPEPPLSK